ncbi:alpha/beta hydrolase family protein [Kribbella amoyensis]|uniref:Alpha/beta hydrolase family protein n=1 Tax=Kribbella amoyensis TaxID=996641 RepID=A0A561BM95_9ACTN|nr:alpha/beta hydrolase [Kribbella amoyensis]TWD79947.1 alpha/beta hydrolase family protein [Kribbella amoyensis]
MRTATRRLRTTAWGVVLGVAATGVGALPTSAQAAPSEVRPSKVEWSDCTPVGDEDPQLVKGSQCATLQVPVDWQRPDGPTFGLAIARRPAKDPARRVGVLVFGPGGPGDSGVSRIKTGMTRFSENLQDRFDIVSLDPRGIGGSNPVKCSAALLARQPSPLIGSQAEFDRTIRYNRELSADCRANTGPVYDHIDSLQSVRDVDAIRSALGEQQLTFHGSSYGTLLGEQYAEVFPRRVRAIVLESSVDHSLGTSAFLDTQAATAQDSFDEFVRWCERSTDCVLHGRDVRALWADLLARAGRGELPDPRDPHTALTPFTLSYAAFRTFYDAEWPKLAGILQQLEKSEPPVVTEPPAPTGLRSNPFAVFCQDWRLPVHSYQQYAAQLRTLGRKYPEMRYPGALLATASCLGAPTEVDNPQHRLRVRDLDRPILLAATVHDPASGYNWATNVARQLGHSGVLLTYEGWGHGSYSTSPCMQAAIDTYLVELTVPRRGNSCPAVPAG